MPRQERHAAMLITSLITLFAVVSVQSTPITKANYTPYYQTTQETSDLTTFQIKNTPKPTPPFKETSSGLTPAEIVSIALAIPGAIVATAIIIKGIIKAKEKYPHFCTRRCFSKEQTTEDTPDGGTRNYQAIDTNMSDNDDRFPTLDDPFKQKHFTTVIKKNLGVDTILKMFNWLKGLSDDEIVKIIHEDLKNIPIEIQTQYVLDAWITKHGGDVKREKIITALEDSGFYTAKANLATHWKDKLDEKCDKKDASYIIGKGDLDWNDLFEMFCNLGLTIKEIERTRGVTPANVTTTTKKVFGKWVEQCQPKIEDLIYALLKAGDLNAAEEIATGWEIPLEKIHELKKKADKD